MFKTLVTLFIFLFSCYAVSGENKTAIASAHPLATYAGFEVLEQGGNVFDAAVAVSAALAVVEPAGSGLGGGGFWLLHGKDFETMIDGREKAPMAARADMYVDPSGRVNERLSKDGPLAAGIPGMPAALVYIAEHFGRLPLSESLKPAIRYAEQGFKIGHRHRRLLSFRLPVMQRYPETAAIFLDQGRIPEQQSLLKQSDLANTLRLLADQGKAGFYQGAVAKSMVDAVQSHGGIWAIQDLLDYQVVERIPVKGEYLGIRLTSAAPPSSGGIVMLEALNILSAYDLDAVDDITVKHLIVEALRRAYHDRALYLGDADFVKIPLQRLISADYAAGLRSSLRMDRALPSSALSLVVPDNPAGRDTTHFSIIDTEGNRVAATLSINFPFGSGFVPPGTGVLLNDEMDDFVSQPGNMNGYGLTGGAANAIAPGKRMLSSMTPTFVEDDQRIGVLGTPGGSRIISMVLLGVLDFSKGHAPESWVSQKRFHHQYLPDRIQYEPGGLSDQEISRLGEMGHHFKPVSYRYGNMQAVQLHKQSGKLTAASDPRGEGLAIVR